MRFRILTAFAAALLLAACETAPEETATTTGGGETASTSDPNATTTAVEIPGPTPGSQEDLLVNVGDRVFFEFDRYDLLPDARGTVEQVAAWMAANPGTTLTIEGHCDERGTREYNLALGERRATAVRNYLTALGVSGSRLASISYGKERPAVLGSNEAAWSQNRRAVFVVN